MSIQTRQPAGTPTGGQFAATTRTETGVALAGDAREEVLDRMVGELLEAGAVSPDSQGIGVQMTDVDHVATVAAWTALGLRDEDEPHEAYVAAARGAVEGALTPNEQAKFWTGLDMYWTDDLHSLCGAMADAVHAAQAPRP